MLLRITGCFEQMITSIYAKAMWNTGCVAQCERMVSRNVFHNGLRRSNVK